MTGATVSPPMSIALLPRTPAIDPAGEDGGDRDSFVASPLEPKPTPNQSSIALPEPTDYERDE